MQPCSSAFARSIRMVRRRYETHTLRRACPKVAHVVRPLLHLVCAHLRLIVDNSVVRCTHRALKTCVRLEVEVKIVDGRDALVDDGASFGVGGTIGVGFACWVKARMMSLAADCDGELWVAGLEGAEGGADFGEFVNKDLVELAFGDTIAEHEDAARIFTLAPLVFIEALDHHRLNVRNHLKGMAVRTIVLRRKRSLTSFLCSCSFMLAG